MTVSGELVGRRRATTAAGVVTSAIIGIQLLFGDLSDCYVACERRGDGPSTGDADIEVGRRRQAGLLAG